MNMKNKPKNGAIENQTVKTDVKKTDTTKVA